MAQIVPFKGVLYSQEKVGSLDLVVAPPYDVITPEQQKELYERSPCNAVRLVFGYDQPDTDTDNRYTRAAADLTRWLEEGVLQQDPAPAIYLCQDIYTLSSQRLVRKGFTALVRLEDYGAGSIKPHEYTMNGPRTDRLKLMQATRANFCPIFSLYSDPWQAINRQVDKTYLSDPDFTTSSRDGTLHKVWRITDARLIERITGLMQDKNVFIADGHHRYETALAFRNEMRQTSSPQDIEAAQYVLMYFANLNDEGTSILPVHRVVRNVPDFDASAFLNKTAERFEVREVTHSGEAALKAMLDQMGEQTHGHTTFGLCLSGRLYVLALRDLADLDEATPAHKPREWRQLTVTVLRYLLMQHVLGLSDDDVAKRQHITYTTLPHEAVQMVDAGDYQLAFFLNPTRLSDVCSVALQGERMPQKSTYFYPKLLSGLVMRSMAVT